MNEVLSEIREYIKNEYFKNEENVRFSLVARILQKLGWDIWNPKEVATEFLVLPNEDSTRVDIALFENPFSPSVFIEIKAVGKLEAELTKCEVQLRDYNRNNTALFSIITDGCIWRFYFSQTGGEFSKKCFKVIDLLNNDLEDIELSFYAFLSKEEIQSGKAKNEAETYLKMNQKQRTMEDALPEARRIVLEPPFPSLLQAIIDIVKKSGFDVSEEEVRRFVKTQNSKKLKEEKTGTVSIPIYNPPVDHIEKVGAESEAAYLKEYRKELKNPNNLISKIKLYIEQKGKIKRVELKRVCVDVFGCSIKSGSIGASIKLLEADGYIKIEGSGHSSVITSLSQ